MIDGNSIPTIATDQMREVDRAMIEDFSIELIQMMENAGRNLARLAVRRFLDGEPEGRRVVVLAGRGGNGGGGLVCARHLHNWGFLVQVFAASTLETFSGVPAKQLDILRRMGIGLYEAMEETILPKADLVIDAIIGYSLRDAPTGIAASLIREVNTVAAPVLALDVPSGVDTTTGEAYEPAVTATATMTLALPTLSPLGDTLASYMWPTSVSHLGCIEASAWKSGRSSVAKKCFASARL